MIEAELKFTFDDLLLVPKWSDLKSRRDPDISTQLGTLQLRLPIVAAPMNTVCEGEMMQLMSSKGGSSVLHRFMDVDQQAKIYHDCEAGGFAAIGALSDKCKERIDVLSKAGCTDFCIDVPFAQTTVAEETVRYLRSYNNHCNIMVGNIATGQPARRLAAAGADIIRVGIGPGSACKTRIVTGHGIPQLSAIYDVAQVLESLDMGVHLVADGGIRGSGDIVKALAAGADAVMIGGLIAGTDEAPGTIYRHTETGKMFKRFAGMASEEGRSKWFGKTRATYVEEGEAFSVPYKGSANKILQDLSEAIQDGLSYSGASNILELQQRAEWVRVTDAGRKEGTPNRRMHRME